MRRLDFSAVLFLLIGLVVVESFPKENPSEACEDEAPECHCELSCAPYKVSKISPCVCSSAKRELDDEIELNENEQENGGDSAAESNSVSSQDATVVSSPVSSTLESVETSSAAALSSPVTAYNPVQNYMSPASSAVFSYSAPNVDATKLLTPDNDNSNDIAHKKDILTNIALPPLKKDDICYGLDQNSCSCKRSCGNIGVRSYLPCACHQAWAAPLPFAGGGGVPGPSCWDHSPSCVCTRSCHPKPVTSTVPCRCDARAVVPSMPQVQNMYSQVSPIVNPGMWSAPRASLSPLPGSPLSQSRMNPVLAAASCRRACAPMTYYSAMPCECSSNPANKPSPNYPNTYPAPAPTLPQGYLAPQTYDRWANRGYQPAVIRSYIIDFGRGYQGCFQDRKPGRDMQRRMGVDHLTPEKCISACASENYRFAGIQYGYLCFCGNKFGKYGRVSDSFCESTCSGDVSKRCGSYWHNSVYSIDGNFYDPRMFDFSKTEMDMNEERAKATRRTLRPNSHRKAREAFNKDDEQEADPAFVQNLEKIVQGSTKAVSERSKREVSESLSRELLSAYLETPDKEDRVRREIPYINEKKQLDLKFDLPSHEYQTVLNEVEEFVHQFHSESPPEELKKTVEDFQVARKRRSIDQTDNQETSFEPKKGSNEKNKRSFISKKRTQSQAELRRSLTASAGSSKDEKTLARHHRDVPESYETQRMVESLIS